MKISTNKLTTLDFVNRCNKIHNNKYDYSMSIYSGGIKHVKIKCNIHGNFNQLAVEHMRGSGCPTCAGKRKLLDNNNTTNFVLYAKKIHKNLGVIHR